MFKYEVYYDGAWLHSESGFESYVETMDDAELYITSKIDCWEADGVEYDKELFGVEVYMED